ncbi:MAG TPA: DoxX family protein [Candidatus Binatus sp.]|nr:DoxX family protein [Candidatus Binatus sp.]
MAVLILRLFAGLLFIVHGYPKLFGSQRKMALGFMKSKGMPSWMATFGGVAEFFGGLALILGILTPIIAFLFVLWMISTTWFSKTKLQKKLQGGYEFDLTLLAISIAIVLLGSGVFSVDHLISI